MEPTLLPDPCQLEMLARVIGFGHLVQLPAMLVARRLFGGWTGGAGGHVELVRRIRRVISTTLAASWLALLLIVVTNAPDLAGAPLGRAVGAVAVILSFGWFFNVRRSEPSSPKRFAGERLLVVWLVSGLGIAVMSAPAEVVATPLGRHLSVFLSCLWLARGCIECRAYWPLYPRRSTGDGLLFSFWRVAGAPLFFGLACGYLVLAVLNFGVR